MELNEMIREAISLGPQFDPFGFVFDHFIPH